MSVFGSTLTRLQHDMDGGTLAPLRSSDLLYLQRCVNSQLDAFKVAQDPLHTHGVSHAISLRYHDILPVAHELSSHNVQHVPYSLYTGSE